MGSREAEQAQFVEVAIAPSLVVRPAGAASPSGAFAQDGAEPAPDISIHLREHVASANPSRPNPLKIQFPIGSTAA